MNAGIGDGGKWEFQSGFMCRVMNRLLLVAGVLGWVALSGSADESAALPVMKAAYAESPVKIDGKLDDAVWKTAQVYPLNLDLGVQQEGKTVIEGGEARLAWDKDNLYVAIRFTDSDIVAEGQEDQLHHYTMGDLVEVFIKPDDQTWYWELYATPAGKKTSFFFPGGGRLGVPSCFTYTCGMAVAAQCDGSLNKWEDRDREWTAEMAVPLKDLTARGEKFEPGAHWRILVSRYNYSRYLKAKELSMTPPMSKTSYHLTAEYAILEIMPKP